MKNISKYFLFVFLFLLYRILPGQFSEIKVQELQQRLDSIISPVTYSGVTISAKVVHADYYQTLFEYQPEAKVIPASITKLITSACAFSKLGQSYQFQTLIYTDDYNLADGVINGNLYLKGYGDPDLNSSDISYLSNHVIMTNIRQVTGNVIADETYFDNNYYSLAGYYSGDTGPSWWPYVNALALDKNKGSSNPALYAVDLLSIFLKSSNIELLGSTIAGKTPEGAKEIAQISHSIYDVISYLNKESDNHSAITVFKLLGAKLNSNPGTIENGQEV
ncbi:MAG: D-alanyl-D-alanine carboxypeptidase, partial [Ignavibacteria bacterium]